MKEFFGIVLFIILAYCFQPQAAGIATLAFLALLLTTCGG